MSRAGQGFEPPIRSYLSQAVISFNSTGDNTIISGVSGKTIRICKVFFVVDAATNVTFKDGSTASTGAFPMAANGAFVLDYDGEPWNNPTASAAWVINQSGTANISGTVYYVQS